MSEKKQLLQSHIVIRRELDEYALLFNPDTNEKYVINPVGTIICENLDGNHSIAEIIEIIKNNFTDITENVGKEVDDFINILHQRKLVH